MGACGWGSLGVRGRGAWLGCVAGARGRGRVAGSMWVGWMDGGAWLGVHGLGRVAGARLGMRGWGCVARGAWLGARGCVAGA